MKHTRERSRYGWGRDEGLMCFGIFASEDSGEERGFGAQHAKTNSTGTSRIRTVGIQKPSPAIKSANRWPLSSTLTERILSKSRSHHPIIGYKSNPHSRSTSAHLQILTPRIPKTSLPEPRYLVYLPKQPAHRITPPRCGRRAASVRCRNDVSPHPSLWFLSPCQTGLVQALSFN